MGSAVQAVVNSLAKTAPSLLIAGDTSNDWCCTAQDRLLSEVAPMESAAAKELPTGIFALHNRSRPPLSTLDIRFERYPYRFRRLGFSRFRRHKSVSVQ